MTEPADIEPRGYVICSTPRSGTNLLCQALESTGLLGRPRDFFNGPGIRAKGRRDYPLDPEAQLALVLAEGRTRNGIYGLKMFCGRFDRVKGTLWTQRLPNLSFVFLEREDMLGQALSQVRADQTGQYRSTMAAGGRPSYDAARIRLHLRAIARDRSRWLLYFARNGIAPVRLTYEQVADAPQQAVDEVARLMEVGEATVRAKAIGLSVQRDSLTEAWRARFLATESDARGLDTLSGPLLDRLGALRDRLRCGRSVG